MTEQKETEIKPVEIGAPLHGEAPAIVFTKLYGTLTDKDGNKQISEFNITTRSNSPEEALELMFRGAEYAKKRFHLSLARPEISVAAPAKAQQITGSVAAPAPNASTAPAPAAPASGPAPSQQGIVPNNNTGVIFAERMEVVPMADGKTTLKWYEKGHQFPDIMTTKSNEKIMNLLMGTGEGWAAEHIRLASSYQVKHEIQWRYSEKNRNRNGNPYKDIVTVRAL